MRRWIFLVVLLLAIPVWASPASEARQKARPAMEAYYKAHPLCEACGAKSGPLRRNEVHHIIPVAVRPDLACEDWNYITFCRACHVAYGHAGDKSCKHYVSNVRTILKSREVQVIPCR